MDFYNMLIQYELNFEKKITKQLNKFKTEIINYSRTINNYKDIENIDEKNIKEIIKEILSSKKLFQFLNLKYKLSNNNKCTIYAKDIIKEKRTNFNNQKEINLNNIIIIPLFKNNLDEEIKKRLFQKIKFKYLSDLNNSINEKKQVIPKNNNLTINVCNNYSNNSLLLTFSPKNEEQTFFPKQNTILKKKNQIQEINKTFRKEKEQKLSKEKNLNLNKNNDNNIRMKRNKNKQILSNNNKSSLISFLQINKQFEKNKEKIYIRNLHFYNKNNKKEICLDKKTMKKSESQGKIIINKLKILGLRKNNKNNISSSNIINKPIF